MADGWALKGANELNPYLNGGYAPVDREVSAADLPVIGEIPKDIAGLYVRNGPNPQAPPAGLHHWFDGDGMLHGLWLEGGKARYANRYMRGADFQAPDAEAPGIFSPANRTRAGNRVYKDTANTDVIVHNGKILALWYISGVPVAVDPLTLETIRDETFSGALPRNISAHSKTDPQTGEFVFFDYALYEPWMSFGTVSREGALTHFTQVELPGPRLPHDMALTSKHIVLMDLPVTFTQKAIAQGTWNIQQLNQPTRFGIIPRTARGDAVKWFEVPPAYIYHVINAWDEGDEVVMAACKMVPNGQTPNTEKYGPYAPMVVVLNLHAVPVIWRFNMKTGAVSETQLDDRISEFPVINLARTGQKNRYGYTVSMAPGPLQAFDGIYKYDLETGAAALHRFPAGTYGSEPAFAPRLGAAAEDDGYLITFTADQAGRSEALILDARDMEAAPLARIALPQRVPFGFHGTWANAEEISMGKTASRAA